MSSNEHFREVRRRLERLLGGREGGERPAGPEEAAVRRSGPEIVLQVLALLQAAQLVVQRSDCRLRGLLRGRLYLDGLAGRRRGGHRG